MNLKEIGYTRETHRFFEDGLHDVVHDEWGMIPEASEDDEPSVDRFQPVSQAERQPARSIRYAEATTGHPGVQGFHRREIRPGDRAAGWKETT